MTRTVPQLIHDYRFARDAGDPYLAASKLRALEETTPALLRCDGDWKVSPHGADEPDRDCYWVDTLGEAFDALIEECDEAEEIGDHPLGDFLTQRQADRRAGL